MDKPFITPSPSTDDQHKTYLEYISKSGVILKADDTGSVRIRQESSLGNDVEIKTTISCKLDFHDISGISIVSPTTAWIHNPQRLRLIDIETGRIIRSFKTDIILRYVNALSDTAILFLSSNEILRFNINDDQTCNLQKLLDVSEVVNSHDYICIAGEKFEGDGELCVVILDSQFCFRSFYDINTFIQEHIPSTLATDLNDNFLVVHTFKDRVRPWDDPHWRAKKRKDITFVSVIDENGQFLFHPSIEEVPMNGIVKICSLDTSGKTWMISDTGEIIISVFERLAKKDEEEE
ncbi:unnamed protein product [Mytilus coruscus]|uniref:Uncharacterized protein n=1 Tax=Mytilus coruscus TaxID=42192 RepID=A0A6J8B367_MYTCO|nr:unnamed protein product [Mytilus coruscus]